MNTHACDGTGATSEQQWVVAPPKGADDNEVGGVVIGPVAPKQQQQFNSTTTEYVTLYTQPSSPVCLAVTAICQLRKLHFYVSHTVFTCVLSNNTTRLRLFSPQLLLTTSAAIANWWQGHVEIFCISLIVPVYDVPRVILRGCMYFLSDWELKYWTEWCMYLRLYSRCVYGWRTSQDREL